MRKIGINRVKTMQRIFAAGLAFILLAGCASVISDRVLREADPTISFKEVLLNPDRFRGRTVVLGGTVLRSIPKKDETWIEVLQQPLGRRLLPRETDISEGRFIVKYRDYLDPAVYRQGRKITVAGEVIGREMLLVGEMQYSYPVLLNRETHLWEPDEDRSPRFMFGIGIGI